MSEYKYIKTHILSVFDPFTHQVLRSIEFENKKSSIVWVSEPHLYSIHSECIIVPHFFLVLFGTYEGINYNYGSLYEQEHIYSIDYGF